MAAAILCTCGGSIPKLSLAGHGSRVLSAPSLSFSSSRKGRVDRGRLLVRCAQEPSSSSAGGGVGIWLGRFAMLGFVATVAVEVTTGKGLLQIAGLTTAAPTAALAVAAVLGLIAAFAIFSSAPKE